MGLLFCAPIALVLLAGSSWAAGSLYEDVVLGVGTVCWVLALWIYCATTARRFHDLGRSGWLTILALLLAVGFGAITVVLLTAPGQSGPNRYGAQWL